MITEQYSSQKPSPATGRLRKKIQKNLTMWYTRNDPARMTHSSIQLFTNT